MLLLPVPHNDTPYDPSAPCPHCCEPLRVELLDVFPPRDFMLQACCEATEREVLDWMQDGEPAILDAVGDGFVSLRQQMAGAFGATPRRVAPMRESLSVDFGLSVRPVPWAVARDFVARHHRHCAPPVGWRFGAGCYNGKELVAVVVVGRPVARALDHSRVVEITRLCVDERLSEALTRNSSSMLLGWAAREAGKRGYEKAITYTMEHERGGSLIAAGWHVDGQTSGGQWSSPSRPRRPSSNTGPKTRWRRLLAGGRLSRNERFANWDSPPTASRGSLRIGRAAGAHTTTFAAAAANRALDSGQ